MSINVVPTGLMGRSLLGVSKLVAASEAFRKECGNKTATATLNDHCHFPDMPFDDFGNQVVSQTAKLTAPLAVVSADNGDSQAALIEKPFSRLAAGETMVQLALPERSANDVGDALTDARDKFLDVANRFDAIMRDIIQLGATRDSEYWWVNNWRLDAHALNDESKFPFVDSGGQSVRVRIFRTVLSWHG